jgi:signal transduction histidine kinase
MLAAGGLMVTLGSALFGYLSASQMLKRVRVINAFCSELGGGDLARRLPVAGGDEFAELSAAINEMLDRISHLMIVVQRVADHAAHDLRTPLQLIRLDLEVALRAAENGAAEVMIVSAIERLDAALDRFARLLEIARNDGASAEGFELINLAELVQETAAIYRPMAEAADLRLELDLRPIRVLSSPPLLQVLLANLIENAIKFSPAGGRIRVATATEAGACLVVEDQGPGIAPEYREQVFHHFMRLRGTEGVSGHGLGLPMVRAIAHRHGLEVRLEDAAPGLRVELRSLDQVNGDLTETVTNVRGKFRLDFGRQFSGNNRMKELHS